MLTGYRRASSCRRTTTLRVGHLSCRSRSRARRSREALAEGRLLARVPRDPRERLFPVGRRTRSRYGDSAEAAVDRRRDPRSFRQRETERLSERGEVHRRHQTGHDFLTCLPDRTLIRDRLQQMLLRSQRITSSSRLLVDLDNFRTSMRGWDNSRDELLKRWRAPHECAPGERHRRRPGGDEFAILAEDCRLLPVRNCSPRDCSTP